MKGTTYFIWKDLTEVSNYKSLTDLPDKYEDVNLFYERADAIFWMETLHKEDWIFTEGRSFVLLELFTTMI